MATCRLVAQCHNRTASPRSAEIHTLGHINLYAPCILYIGQTYRYSTDRHHASYIQDRRTATPQIGTMHPIYRTDVPLLPRAHFLYIQSTNTLFNYFFRLSLSLFIPPQNVVYFLMLPFLNKEFLCITRTVKHNCILPISTARIQLHVSVLYVDHLQVEIFNLQISYTRCVGHLCGWGGTRSRCFNSGYRDPELLEVNFLQFCVMLC